LLARHFSIGKNKPHSCANKQTTDKAIPSISKQMLVNQLREMEADQILDREVYAEVPPRVEYKISAYGQTLLPIIAHMSDWGLKDLKKD